MTSFWMRAVSLPAASRKRAYTVFTPSSSDRFHPFVSTYGSQLAAAKVGSLLTCISLTPDVRSTASSVSSTPGALVKALPPSIASDSCSGGAVSTTNVRVWSDRIPLSVVDCAPDTLRVYSPSPSALLTTSDPTQIRSSSQLPSTVLVLNGLSSPTLTSGGVSVSISVLKRICSSSTPMPTGDGLLRVTSVTSGVALSTVTVAEASDWLPAASLAVTCTVCSLASASPLTSHRYSCSPAANTCTLTSSMLSSSSASCPSPGSSPLKLMVTSSATDPPSGGLVSCTCGRIVSSVMLSDTACVRLPAMSLKRTNTDLFPSPGSRLHALSC